MMGLSIVVSSSFRLKKAATAGEKNKSPAAPQIELGVLPLGV
jgi:hypothetical protein